MAGIVLALNERGTTVKKLILIAGCVALAACSKSEAPKEAEAATTETAAAEAPAEEVLAGTYDVTAADGAKTSVTIDAANNYTVMADGKEAGRGTVAMTKDQTCFNAAEEGSAPVCWTAGEPAADGSYVSTNDDGEKVTVMKRKDAAAAM